MMRTTRVVALCAAAAAIIDVSASAEAAGPAHVRGTIASFSSTSVTIATARGPVVFALGPKTAFAGAMPASVADIKPGTFVGSANVPGAGAAKAIEVVVFPESMRGRGEGDYPWDLAPAGGTHSSMTNGTVAAPKGSSMTNATVSHVTGSTVKTITVEYKGGTKQIAISPNTPIVTLAPGSSKLLVRGAHVFAIVVTPGDAKPLGAFVVVGRGGTVPPM
jgi:hypothetical protein